MSVVSNYVTLVTAYIPIILPLISVLLFGYIIYNIYEATVLQTLIKTVEQEDESEENAVGKRCRCERRSTLELEGHISESYNKCRI